MTATTLNSIAIGILGLSIIVSNFTNIDQTKRLDLLQEQVNCLEQGRIYVGDNYCTDPLTE